MSTNPGGALIEGPPGNTPQNLNDIQRILLRLDNLERWIQFIGTRLVPPIAVPTGTTGGGEGGDRGGPGSGGTDTTSGGD
ncbi:hypothetical protein ACHAQJ_001298 [Trichoderma viride]